MCERNNNFILFKQKMTYSYRRPYTYNTTTKKQSLSWTQLKVKCVYVRVGTSFSVLVGRVTLPLLVLRWSRLARRVSPLVSR